MLGIGRWVLHSRQHVFTIGGGIFVKLFSRVFVSRDNSSFSPDTSSHRHSYIHLICSVLGQNFRFVLVGLSRCFTVPFPFEGILVTITAENF